MADPRVIWIHVRQDRRGQTWIAAYPTRHEAKQVLQQQGGRLVRYERQVGRKVRVAGFARI